ncbi:3-ketoacyl-CoA reductase [Auricularia subglabra TFB-10046 SS5]|nr:3-ketoacyl-CoA reductase [Auricularia subglabra TFB-10046 SS5]
MAPAPSGTPPYTALLNPRVLALVLSTLFPFTTFFVFATGIFRVLRLVFGLVRLILQLTILPGENLGKYGAKKGAWAVVTGATDGIGREFAFQLASKGFNVLLVSRTQAKLKAAEEEILQKYPGVQTRSIALDYETATDADYEPLRAAAVELDVRVLVNNVGRSHDMPVSFATTPLDELSSIVGINVLGTLRTTRAILPSMLARKEKALILTLSSFASTPTPLLATYSGSKAFLVSWNASLAAELKSSKINARIVNTFYVVSAMSKIRRSSLMVPTPRSFVRAALRLHGSTGTRAAYTPYWSHALMDLALEQLDLRGLWTRLALRTNSGIRARALKKQAREQKAQ